MLGCFDEPDDDDDDDDDEGANEDEVEALSNDCFVLMTVASSFAHSKMGFTRLALVSPPPLSPSLTESEMRVIAWPRAVSIGARARSRVSLVWGSRDLYLGIAHGEEGGVYEWCDNVNEVEWVKT